MMDRAKNTVSIFLSSRHAAIYLFLWSFVVSIIISSFVSVSPWVSILLLIIAVGICASEKIVRGKVPRDVSLACLVLFACALGTFRYAVKDFHEASLPDTTGIVAGEPEHRDMDTRFVFLADNGEKVLVSTDLLSPIEYGDRVEVLGKLKVPGVIIDDISGREFDYGKYLSKDDIYYTESFARVTRLTETADKFEENSLIVNSPMPDREQAKSSRIISTLLKVKNSFLSHIKKILPEPEASLLAGLIVAGKEALPGNILDDFKHAGVVHIVVLSGYNVTIIAEFFLFIFSFLGLRRAASASAIGIVFFTLMTGATATVVRAAIMVLALLVGKIIGRPYNAGRMLLVTAFLMIMWNPKVLIFDPSFQLSFLAMLALVYVVPVVDPLIQKLLSAPRLNELVGQVGQASGKSRPIVSGLATLVSVTIATQITALPFLLYSIGNISIVSIFTNILILFTVPYTMLIGFVAVLISYVSPILAWPITFVTHILLRYILGVAHFFGNLSFASIQINHVSAWFMIALYIVLIAFIVRLRSLLPHSAN